MARARQRATKAVVFGGGPCKDSRPPRSIQTPHSQMKVSATSPRWLPSPARLISSSTISACANEKRLQCSEIVHQRSPGVPLSDLLFFPLHDIIGHRNSFSFLKRIEMQTSPHPPSPLALRFDFHFACALYFAAVFRLISGTEL